MKNVIKRIETKSLSATTGAVVHRLREALFNAPLCHSSYENVIGHMDALVAAVCADYGFAYGLEDSDGKIIHNEPVLPFKTNPGMEWDDILLIVLSEVLATRTDKVVLNKTETKRLLKTFASQLRNAFAKFVAKTAA